MRFLPLFCYPLPDAASKIQAHLVNIHCHEFLPDVLLFSFTYFFDQIVCGLNKMKITFTSTSGQHPLMCIKGPLFRKYYIKSHIVPGNAY